MSALGRQTSVSPLLPQAKRCFRGPEDTKRKQEYRCCLSILHWAKETERGQYDGVVAIDYGMFRRAHNEWCVNEDAVRQ